MQGNLILHRRFMYGLGGSQLYVILQLAVKIFTSTLNSAFIPQLTTMILPM